MLLVEKQDKMALEHWVNQVTDKFIRNIIINDEFYLLADGLLEQDDIHFVDSEKRLYSESKRKWLSKSVPDRRSADLSSEREAAYEGGNPASYYCYEFLGKPGV